MRVFKIEMFDGSKQLCVESSDDSDDFHLRMTSSSMADTADAAAAIACESMSRSQWPRPLKIDFSPLHDIEVTPSGPHRHVMLTDVQIDTFWINFKYSWAERTKK